eukprot:2048509-Rhodomonas_salina.2
MRAENGWSVCGVDLRNSRAFHTFCSRLLQHQKSITCFDHRCCFIRSIGMSCKVFILCAVVLLQVTTTRAEGEAPELTTENFDSTLKEVTLCPRLPSESDSVKFTVPMLRFPGDQEMPQSSTFFAAVLSLAEVLGSAERRHLAAGVLCAVVWTLQTPITRVGQGSCGNEGGERQSAPRQS